MSGTVGLALRQCASLELSVRTLEDVLQMLLLLKGEIRYGNIPLMEVFREVSAQLPTDRRCSGFLRMLIDEMKDDERRERFGNLFARCMDRCFGDAGLNFAQLMPLYRLGEQLGYLDNAMQLRQLERTEETIRSTLQELKQELPQKRKLYRSLGILGGLMLVLLLW